MDIHLPSELDAKRTPHTQIRKCSIFKVQLLECYKKFQAEPRPSREELDEHVTQCVRDSNQRLASSQFIIQLASYSSRKNSSRPLDKVLPSPALGQKFDTVRTAFRTLAEHFALRRISRKQKQKTSASLLPFCRLPKFFDFQFNHDSRRTMFDEKFSGRLKSLRGANYFLATN